MTQSVWHHEGHLACENATKTFPYKDFCQSIC